MLIPKTELVDPYQGLFHFGSYQISGKLNPKSLLVTNYFNSLCLGTAGGLQIHMQHCTEKLSFSAMQD